MDTEFFKDKLVLIMGLGKFGGGVDVAKFACDAGANVLVTDLADAEQLKDSIAERPNHSDPCKSEFRYNSMNIQEFSHNSAAILKILGLLNIF